MGRWCGSTASPLAAPRQAAPSTNGATVNRPLVATPSQRRRVRLAAAICGGWLVLAFGASPARAAVVHCGDTVTHDTTLSNDVTNCPANGINIGADGIVVNLNGHTISQAADAEQSTGTGGVHFNGHNHVTVRNGYVRGFFNAGVYIDGSDNTIQRVTSVQNGVGVAIFGDRNRINDSRQDQNGTGISTAGAAHNTISYDRATNNETGMQLDANFSNSSNTISYSTISGNSGDGIFLFSESNDTISHNTLDSNGGSGINDFLAYGTTIVANTASRNTTGFSFADCFDPQPLTGCSGPELIRNNQALRNKYGFAAGLFFTGTFTGNRAHLNSHAGFRFRGSNVTLLNNIAGSVSSQSGATEGNGIGIDVGVGQTDDPEFFGTLAELRGNSANSNKGGPDGLGDGILVRDDLSSVTITGSTTNFNAGDGINVPNGNATLTSNRANRNRRYGIEAPGSADGGGNSAFGNLLGQCIGVACS